MFNSFYRAIFGKENDSKNTSETELILSNNNSYSTNTMYNPIEKRSYFLEDLTLYNYNSSYNCIIKLLFYKNGYLIDSVIFNGKLYEKGDETFSKYSIDYTPKYDSGKLKIEFIISYNEKIIDKEIVSFNYIIHELDNSRNKNVVFNTKTHRLLLYLDVNCYNKYFIRDIFCFKN